MNAHESCSVQTIGRPTRASASIDTIDAGTPANITGNTVQLDSEVTDLQKEGLQYQAVASAISFKYSLLRTAIGS